MYVIALDLGVKTGWALARDGALLESGVQTFELKRGESAGMRYLRFSRWLEDLAPAGGRGVPVLWVYEQAHHRGGYTTEVHNGLATRVQEYAARDNTNYHAVHSSTLKKWLTGRGNAQKDQVIQAVQRRWQCNVLDDNHADALALLHYALETLVPARS